MQRSARTEAQALVEFALASTVIFLLLAAAVDLGLLFFTKQGITNAAQEGATYGSRWLIDDASGIRKLDVAQIQDRVRRESGDNGGNGVLRLTDLNSDGIVDTSQGTTVLDPTGKNGSIQVSAVEDTNLDGNPTNDSGKLCANPATSSLSCYALVSVSKVYNFFFPFAAAVIPTKLTLKSSYYVLIRDSYRTNSSTTPPTFVVPTATPSIDDIVVQVVVPTGATFPRQSTSKFQVKAYDKSKSTTDGDGIAHVLMQLYKPGGAVVVSNDDSGASYCLNSGTCNPIPVALYNTLPTGVYTFTATAYAPDGRSKSVSVTFTK